MSNGRGLISRILAPLAKAVEGAYRPGPYYLPLTGGWLPDSVGKNVNWWQLGYDPIGISSQSAMVEACVSAYSQTVAMCPGTHWRLKSDGGRDRITTSALHRILRQPNVYQTISDFLLNGVRSVYLEGNCYALALRNSRFEVEELHLMDSRQSWPLIAETGDVFYHLAGNDVIDKQTGGKPLTVPARDVLHIRLHSADRKRPYPLKGETPLTAAIMDMAAGNAIQQQQIQFYLNQARPSAVLSTDQVLRPEQVQQLRQGWNEQAKGLEAGCGPGGTPILTAGLKVVPWGTAGKDSQLAEMVKMSDEKIALAFRIPMAILGVGGMQTFGSTEILMGQWISSGLGFCLNHVEESFGQLFQLKGQPEEYVEFDTSALLRSAFKDRIDGLVKAVQGGVLSPNEARLLEGFPKVEFGDEPRVQQQVVPLSAAAGIPHTPPAPRPGAAPPAPGPDDKPPPADDKPPPEKSRKDLPDARAIRAAADRYERRRLIA
jgi:HK97 family phage portal protein